MKKLIVALGAIWLIGYFIIPSVDSYIVSILLYAGINAILAMSLNLVNGCTGQFSMGHAGFMSIGGYIAALITLSLPIQTGLFPLAILTAGCVAAFAGLIVGLPSLRLRGDYLAIVTLGFGEIIRVVLLNINVIGGARGLPNIAHLSNFSWVFGCMVITLFSIERILRSPYGRAFLAVREDEVAAEAMGVDTTHAKLQAFVIGAFFAGCAGALFAHTLRYLNPQIFDFNRSFEIIIIVVLGGMGNIRGSIIAAFLLTFMREALRPLQDITRIDFRMIIYAIMLISLMLLSPEGILSSKWRKRGRS